MARRHLEYVPVDELRPHPENPKLHADDELDASLERFGYTEPVMVDERTGYLVAGHGRRERVLAARAAGKEPPDGVEVDEQGRWTIPTTRGWASADDDEARAYLVTSNRLTELGGWHEGNLAAILVDLEQTRNGLDGVGYNSEQLTDILTKLAAEESPPEPSRRDPDKPPPVPDEPHSRPGDIWVCGPHRVMCGDATRADHLDLLLEGRLADLVWTDPPYGVKYEGGTVDELTILNDDLAVAELEAQLLRPAFTQAMRHTRPGGCWYVASPTGPHFLAFARPLLELGIWRQTIVWEKDQLVLGRADYHGRHEAIFYGWEPAATPPPPPGMNVPPELEADHFEEAFEHVLYGWNTGAAHRPPPNRKQDNVWQIPRPKRSKDHPTMKPVALVERAIRNSTRARDLILDPFGGSGTTLVAAHQLKRHARLLELDPRYVDVIARRYQELTGDQPRLEATGEPHDFTRKALDTAA